MVKPMAAHPRRSASCTEPVMACTGAALSRDKELALLTFMIVGICPAKLSAPASNMPSGAA